MASKDEPVKTEIKRKRTIRKETTSIAASGDSKRIKSDAAVKESKSGLFFAEEEEVDSRNPQNDLTTFRKTCEEIRTAMAEIKKLKEKKGKDYSEEIEEKKINALLQFVVLKKLNRLAHVRCKKVRDATSETKQRIDQYHLQLQNLLYETMHLEKEITRCLEFKSKDEEIELVSVDEFYQEAPKDISRPEVTKSDSHQKTLARLDWELEQRKRLDLKLKEAKDNKEKLEQEIKTKQEYLENLQPKLNTILQSTKPVQEYLGMPFDQIREQHQTACHLPHPLYVLYMQSSAYKQACDKHLEVRIEGDLQAAKSIKSSVTEIDEDSDSDQEEQDKPASKRRRKTSDSRVSDRKNRALQRHPLAVVMEISCRDGGCLHLTFHYQMSLEIITVDTKFQPSPDNVTSSISGGDLLSAESVLNDIYPGDHGNTTPNPANQYELRRLGLRDFTHYIPELGRPFLWAQWLGGLQFLDHDSPLKAQSSISSAHMQQTVKLLRRRIRSRTSLLQQLASLERGSIQVNKDYLPLFPAKIVARLVSWKRSTYEDFSVLPHARSAITAGLAGESDLYFTAIMERSSAKMTVQVVLTANYPEVVPWFVVGVQWQTNRTALNDSHIQAMEEEVNLHYQELMKEKSHDQILSNQMQRLMMCFDIYLETEAQNTESEGPMEISKEKVFTRVTRGPNRTKPYMFCPEVGIFTHR
ncbi:THO complex subunit 5 homolog isoform X2 [Pecten maximus]|uniref:THO complex subunit 5 homolog isoform X1 n=1 Tax=Pecten maximus TaxID=6579 RepID=UPI001457F6C6|nr:THO complex subunit 5 homolog isoform X1 [Pecten maximus]XP_033747385.1 THO complex subunit 5 homolog isoform X2 [Pecten maximus]